MSLCICDCCMQAVCSTADCSGPWVSLGRSGRCQWTAARRIVKPTSPECRTENPWHCFRWRTATVLYTAPAQVVAVINAFATELCRRRCYAFRPSHWNVHPIVRSDMVTMISHEQLEQFCYSLAPVDDLIRFWRSKIKVTAGHWGEQHV